MRKIICNKVYDTETAKLIKKVTYSYYGDPNGYEEILFQNEGGFFFIYTNGGATSKYPTEKITRRSAIRAGEWLKNNENN